MKRFYIDLVVIFVLIQFIILLFFLGSDYLIVSQLLSIIVYSLPFFNLTSLLFIIVFNSIKKENYSHSNGLKSFILLIVAIFSLIPFVLSIIFISVNPIIEKYTYKNNEGAYLFINRINNEWAEEKQDNYSLYLSNSNSKWYRKVKFIDSNEKFEILSQHINKTDEIVFEGNLYLSKENP